MDNKYYELMKERPELFMNLRGGIEILCNDKDIAEVERIYETKIGIVYEDKYIVFIKDAVRFPDGTIAPYIRIYHKKKGGVAILPVFNGKIVLLKHFRHSLRKWLFETPRGFCEEGLSNQKNAERELFEELGIKNFSLIKMGDMVPDAGIVGEKITLYFAQLDDDSDFNIEIHEGIEDYVVLNRDEVVNKIGTGEINDGITISSIMLAMIKGLI